jgi:catechol 2,3-dioxygenase-like lactoylglutathione lyase family enzyme
MESAMSAKAIDQANLGADSLKGIVMRAPAIAATKQFYVENWGLTVAAEQNNTVYFRGTGPEPFIYALREDATFGIDYINFGMDSVERLEALHAKLKKKGIPIVEAMAALTIPGGGHGFTIRDPDNRRLQFIAGSELNTDITDVQAQPRKASHVVLNTPNLEGLQAFYLENLAFRTSDYSANQMVFLRCNTDHHAIAFNRSPYPSVNHVAFEMPSIDSFMRGIGRMRVKGQSPAWGPGRHGPGNNPFAYFVSPSGFVIEFTSEVQQIDEETHEAKIWSRDDPQAMDQWMTAGPPTPAMRAVMQGRPDPGFPDSRTAS